MSDEKPVNISRDHWTISRQIPAALLFAIALQTIAFSYWMGTVSSRVTEVENKVSFRASDPERIAKLEVHINSIKEAILRVEKSLQTKGAQQ